MNVLIGNGVELLQHGAQHDRSHEYDKAYAYYYAGLELLEEARKLTQRQAMKQEISRKMNEFVTRSEAIRTALGPQRAIAAIEQYESRLYEQQQKKALPKATQPTGSPAMAATELSEQTIPQSTTTTVRWDDIAGLEEAKEMLREAVILPNLFPKLFSGERSAWKAALLYGPPGTGKSYLAKAVATEANASFFSVTSSDLLSKWMGESEKQVRKLFENARAARPSVIFVDEIDALCGDRNTTDNTKRVVAEFLTQMDGFGSDNAGMFVLAATNFPGQLDVGIRRRFEKRIYIGLPDSAARIQLLRLHLGKTLHTISNAQFNFLAQHTDGFSGADIAVLVRDALMLPVRRMLAATHFRRVEEKGPQQGKWVPCAAEELGAEQRTMVEIGDTELADAVITAHDFVPALKTMHASVSPNDLQQYRDFQKLH